MTGRTLHVDLASGTGRLLDDGPVFSEWLGGSAAATELLFRHGDPKGDPLAPESPVIFTIGPFSALYPVATKTAALFKSLSPESWENPTPEGGCQVPPGGGHRRPRHHRQGGPPLLPGHRKRHRRRQIGLDLLGAVGHGHRPDPAGGGEQNGTEDFRGPHRPRRGAALPHGLRHGGRLPPFRPPGTRRRSGSKTSSRKSSAWTKTAPGEAEEFKEVYDILYDRVVRSKEMKKYHDLGTAANVRPLSMIRGLPTRNFSQGNFEGAGAISGERFAEKFLVQHTACAHCQCGCIHLAELREEFAPYHYSTNRVSYDYELIYAMGSMLSLSSPEDIMKLLLVTEKQGWDVISLGCTLAWATESFLRGNLSLEETGGLSLSFGDGAAYLEVLERMAKERGEFYRDLEKGCAFCAGKYGGEEWAVQYGGAEPGGYMTGENFAVTCMMGVRHSHLDDTGYSIDQKLLNAGQPLEDQVRAQVKEAQWRMVLNSLMICLFARGVYDEEVILRGLDALGLEWDAEKLQAMSEKALLRKYDWQALCGFDHRSGEDPGKNVLPSDRHRAHRAGIPGGAAPAVQKVRRAVSPEFAGNRKRGGGPAGSLTSFRQRRSSKAITVPPVLKRIRRFRRPSWCSFPLDGLAALSFARRLLQRLLHRFVGDLRGMTSTPSTAEDDVPGRTVTFPTSSLHR